MHVMSRQEIFNTYKEGRKSLFIKEIEDGIIAIDKPEGITSYDVIRLLKSRFPKQKIGHAGTLDPCASGLMIVGVGRGTKKLNEYLKLRKTYEAVIEFGKKTTTADRDGEVVEERPYAHISKESIIRALQELEGIHEYPVPMYSAIHKDGKRLYEYARKGVVVDVPHKSMHVHTARLLEYNPPCANVVFDVSSGTYIRTLAEVLAEHVGTVAHLEQLRRIRIGTIDL